MLNLHAGAGKASLYQSQTGKANHYGSQACKASPYQYKAGFTPCAALKCINITFLE
jgi:hypothetical protein